MNRSHLSILFLCAALGWSTATFAQAEDGANAAAESTSAQDQDAASGAAGAGLNTDANPGAGIRITDHEAESSPAMNSGYVEAPSSPTINNLPAGGTVTLKGTIEQVKDSDNFILNDTTGTIPVRLENDARLAVGDSVTVVGRVDRNWEGDRIVGATAQRSNIYYPARQSNNIIIFGRH